MSQPRTIKDYFKRPSFPLRLDEPFQNSSKPTPEPNSIPAASQPSSSPLSDPPSDLPSRLTPSQPPLDAGPGAQLKEALLDTLDEVARHHPAPSSSESNAELRRSSSLGAGSFNSSQRVIRNGKEVVIDSEVEEDTDSLDDLADPDDLLNMFMKPPPSSDHKSRTTPSAHSIGKPRPPREKNSRIRTDGISMPVTKTQKYKFSLSSLVTHAVDDDEAEAGVAKAKAALESRHKAADAANNTDGVKSNGADIHEGVLASAFDEQSEETDLQRLLNAVRRTEAFDQEKSWAYFGDAVSPMIPEFPRDSILPSSREAFLRGCKSESIDGVALLIDTVEPASRDRAFHSGILDFALSRDLLPDEFLLWILYSVPVEPRDDLRYAYTRALKHASSQRIAAMIRPGDIDEVFLSLGAKPVALDLSATLIPESTYDYKPPSHSWKFLLSVLDLLRDISDKLGDDSRKHALQILFRLTLDTSIVRTNLVCSALQTTTDAVLQSFPQESFDDLLKPVCISVFNTVQDVSLQSQLLKHILPTTSWIALLRCRLATAFFIRDASPLEESADNVLDLKRITRHLRDHRFDVKHHKARKSGGYDYSELGAITSLLNIAIDLGRLTPTFPDKEAENDFNAHVDGLAERVKRIFSAIEDSGASHLKRTETKQSLEALHYRIVYSVRSKPPPKKSFFGVAGPEDWNGLSRSGSLMDKFLSNGRKGDDTESVDDA